MNAEPSSPTTLTFADFVVDLEARTVERMGDTGPEPIPVEPQVFDVLAVLIQNSDRVVSKLELFDTVWGDRFVSPATLTSRVRDLRAALGDSGAQQAIIKTAHGRGFQFVAPLDAIATGRDATAITPARRGLKPLLGRDEFLVEIDRRLGEGRLVTLVGPGGVGKTHLMRHATIDLNAAIAELADVRDAATVPRTILADAGGTERADIDPTQTLIEFLQGRDIVLVVDNCEHVIDATTELISVLLANCPELRILATSRRPLLLRDESVIKVGPLPAAAATEMLVQQARRHGVELVAPETVARICQRLDCLPLAIELAGSKTRALPLDALSSLLDDRFGVLVTDDVDAATHHRSLETAIDWSVELLSESQRRLLAKLSVLVGPFDLAAARAVGGEQSVVADLMALTDLSLVAFDPASGRYRLLESIRLFAAELGIDASTIDRHRDHVLQVVEAAGLIDFDHFLPSLQTITDQWANLRVIVGRAIDENDALLLHRVIAAVAHYAEQTFAFEVLEWADAAFAIDNERGGAPNPNTLAFSAILLTHRNQLDDARARIDAASSADPDLLDTDLLDLARLWHGYFSGDLATADAVIDEIRQRSVGEHSYGRGIAAVTSHFLDKAAQRPFSPEAIAFLEQAVDEAGETTAKVCAALRLDWATDGDRAIEQLTEAVAEARALGLAFLASGASTALSIALIATPEAQTSVRGLRAALRGYVESGSWQFAAADFAATANTLLHHGKPVPAAELLGAREASGFVGDTSSKIAERVRNLAVDAIGERDVDDAIRQGRARDIAAATRIAIRHLTSLVEDDSFTTGS